MQRQLKQLLVASDDRGFTLIELLVVIAIIGAVVAISIPNMKVWLDHSRVNRDSRTILGALQKARIEAVKRNEYCAVAFTATGYTMFLDRTTPNPNRVYDAGDVLLSTASLNFATLTHNFGGAAIFNSRGLPSSSAISTSFHPGTVTLKGGPDDYTREVVVNSVGRIRVK